MAKKKQQVDEFQAVKKDISTFSFEVPDDIINKVEKQLKLEKERPKISVSILIKELMAVAPERKSIMLLSVIVAMFAEVFNFATYFFSAYGAMWILAYSKRENPDFNNLIKYGAFALASIIIYLILSGISTILSHNTAFTILSKLRVSLFEKLEKIPLGYMIENPVGKIKVTIMEKVGELEDWVAHVMPEIPSKMIHPIIGAIILFYIDWRIGLSLLAPVPIILIGMSMMMNKYRARGLVWACAYENVADRSAEYVKGIPVIKAFLQEDKSYEHFSDAVGFYYNSTMDWWKVSWLSTAVVFAGLASPLIATLPISLLLYSKAVITVSELVLTLVIAVGLLPQLLSMLMGMDIFMLSANAWLIISELLHMPDQERPSADEKVELDSTKGVEFEDVSFSYINGVEVLNDVNFSTEKNSITALVGPSGSGKSTIAKLMLSYWDVNKGSIKLGGVDIKDISFKQLMEEISYVSQDNFLFDTSVKDNIRLGKPDATDEEIISAAKMASCHDFIMSLENGYDTRVGDAGGQLSGGERQRITLARAILKPANIIVLDEATAYTDPENEALIQEGISKLVKSKSLIVIAHRLHTIRNAQKIVVIDKGQVVAEGKHDELLEKCELYARLNRQYEREV